MIRGENSDSIPIDLVMEILSRLPAKSTARFRCVSKLWNDSVLSRPYFTELFLTRSSARPRLLFAVERLDGWCLFTSPQLQNPYHEKSSSLVVTADFQMKFPGDTWLERCGHASGFICFRRGMRISTEEDDRMICNPSTGQYAILPLPKRRRPWRSFLGFDPIDNKFKVLCVIVVPNYDEYEKEEPDQILTLGTGNDLWRTINCPLNHVPIGEEICINGVLYYFAAQRNDDLPCIIVCFDVRSEKFKFIDIHFLSYQHDTYKLINYKGKLGVITLLQQYDCSTSSIELCMWVIKDVVKPESEWSKYFSFFWDDEVVIVGVTATGDIVLSMLHWDASKPFYVFYLSPERNTLQNVEIKGFGANQFDSRSRVKSRRVKVFVDHVEDLKFITTYAAKAHLQQDGLTF